MCETDIRKGLYLAAKAIFRGDVDEYEVEKEVYDVQI